VLALPPPGRRVPSSGRALPLLPRSYGLMRRSCYLSLTSAEPSSRSPCRFLSAPAANRTFSTLFCESFLRCLSPYPGGPAECICLVLPQRHRPSPNEKWVGFPLMSRKRNFSRTPISWLQLFLYVQASEFVCLPGRSYRGKFPCRAAEAFTSEQNVHRCLCTYRICYPPDYRQLAERGLSPRKIHSIVDCSSHFKGPVHLVPAARKEKVSKRLRRIFGGP
jgi:hypothetical protein